MIFQIDTNDKFLLTGILIGSLFTGAVSAVRHYQGLEKQVEEQAIYCTKVMARVQWDEKEWCPIGLYGAYYFLPSAANPGNVSAPMDTPMDSNYTDERFEEGE